MPWGLLCSQKPQAPSRWGEGTERLLQRVLEARGRLREPLHSRGSARKREREKERHGDQMEQRCFNQHGVGIYTVVILSKDKD